MKINKGFGFLFEMGCGKTLTAIATAGVAWERGYIKRLLIIAPASVCAVWPKEFEDYAAYHYEVRLMMGDKKKRLKALEELTRSKRKALAVAVINYESAWRDGILEAILSWDPDMVICDESQRIKTHDAQQSKGIHKIGDKARYKLILSGTPVQNNAIDLYSQYRFMDPEIFGTNFYKFRARYAVMGGFNQKQIIGYRNMEELIQKEYSAAYRVTKEDALDLPEQSFINRYLPLDLKDYKLYRQIMKESYAEIEGEEHVTASTVLTRILRLQQLAGGFLKTDEAEEVRQVNTAKLDALRDILQDYVQEDGRKLVIFARFVAEIHAIEELCRSMGIKYSCIYGAIPKEERGAVVADFQNNPETMVFIGQIDSAGTGITLTAASTCVYYSLTYNYATYTQSLARIHRIGQRNACTYIHLIAAGTVDEAILKALEAKEDLARTVVDSWRMFFE